MTELGTDAWSREAQRVRERAVSLGLTLDEEELARQDVRDLQALHRALQVRPTRIGRLALQGLWPWGARARMSARGT